MKRETSIYLDGVRFLAAAVVFVGHVSGQRFTGGFLWPVGRYMDAAVMVFFVLSGFVIAYAVSARERTLEEYFVNRAARIYSVALPALLVTFLLDAVGRSVRPGLYSAAWGYQTGHPWLQFFSGLTSTNQLWGVDIPQGSDVAGLQPGPGACLRGRPIAIERSVPYLRASELEPCEGIPDGSGASPGAAEIAGEDDSARPRPPIASRRQSTLQTRAAKGTNRPQIID